MKNEHGVSRRHLLQSAALGGALSAMGLRPTAAAAAGEGEAVQLSEGDVVLIQGDSITDAGRSRRHQDSPNNTGALGRGYAQMIATRLLGDMPYKKLKVYNRGISGNKVPDLQSRWEADALSLKPALLSILIGVNDIWHKLGGRYDGTVDDYEKGFADLLAETKQKLPEVKLVVCEPFVLRCGAVNDNWFPEFDQRRARAKNVAEQAGTIFVPFQAMFDEAVKHATPQYWAGDGVHPTLAGHALMAATWMNVVFGQG